MENEVTLGQPIILQILARVIETFSLYCICLLRNNMLKKLSVKKYSFAIWKD